MFFVRFIACSFREKNMLYKNPIPDHIVFVLCDAFVILLLMLKKQNFKNFIGLKKFKKNFFFLAPPPRETSPPRKNPKKNFFSSPRPDNEGVPRIENDIHF
jgi:hypothetical protein